MSSTSDYHIACRCPENSVSGENLDDRTARRAATLAEATLTARRYRQLDPMTRSTPKARSFTALRLARAAAGTTTETAAAVCGLTDQELRKHLRNLPARGRCAATVGALAAAQRTPQPPNSAAVGHRACPPPAVRAARLTDPEAVTAARGSASWTLGHLPHRGDSMDIYVFSLTPHLHRSVMVGLAVANDQFYRKGVAHNPNCPPAILDRLAHDPNESVRDAVMHNLRKCCCDELTGQECTTVQEFRTSLAACQKLRQDYREEDARTMSLRCL